MNVVRRCGTDIEGNWEVVAAGIAVAASHDVEIYGNIIENCPYGISAFQQPRPELQPEFGKSFDYGFVYDPSWVSGLSINADYYRILLNNLIVLSRIHRAAI